MSTKPCPETFPYPLIALDETDFNQPIHHASCVMSRKKPLPS